MTTLRYRYPKSHHRGPSGWLEVEVVPASAMDAVVLSCQLQGVEVDPRHQMAPVRCLARPSGLPGAMPGQLGLFGGAR